jgi:DNA-binding transcriptional LysR family regulator
MIDIVAEGYDAGIRLEESVPQDMIAVPLTGEIRQLVTATPDYFARHGIPQTPDDLLHIRGSACVWPTAGSTAGSWPVGETYALAVPPRFATSDLFASIRAVKAGLGVGFLPELYIQEELKAGTGERLKRLGAAVCRAAPVLPWPSPRPARAAGAGGDDPRARDYSRLALFSP